MAITKYPLIDAFETTLSQEWDGNTGTIYVNSVPDFTFPSGVTMYIVVDADNSKIQVAEINAISTGAKTMTVNSVSVAKGNGVAYTSQVHSIGAKVRISDNHIFWKTIVDAVNGIETSTVQTNVNGTTIGTYANASARDAAITSPVNGKYQAYLTSEGYWTDYVGGSWQQRATGVTPNASTTVSGKVEIATDAQITAGTAVGETGASLVATPNQLKKSISLKNSTSSFNDADEFSINQGGEDKRITKTAMRDQLAASTTAKGTVEMAEDSEAVTGTDESRYINSKQLRNWSGYTFVSNGNNTESILASSDGGGSTSISGATKVKEIVIPAGISGVLDISFQLQDSGTGDGNGFIYKNGSSTGLGTSTTQVSYTTYSFGQISVSGGDLIQLYVGAGTSGFVNYQNFRLRGTIKPLSASFTVNL